MVILVIEDDEALAELIKEKIKEKIKGSGRNIISVGSANDAVLWLSDHIPDIMLIDYTLPDMNAKEFIFELRKKETPLPPFVVSTGQGDERIAVDMMKLGARDYILKDSNFLDMINLKTFTRLNSMSPASSVILSLFSRVTASLNSLISSSSLSIAPSIFSQSKPA